VNPAPPVFRFACHASECELTLPLSNGVEHRHTLPACGADDEEHSFAVGNDRVILRRVLCAISDGLLRRRDHDPRHHQHGDRPWCLSPQTRAALLWRAFQRYRELVGLKRLSGGLSGGDVLVFRPRLRTPTFPPIGPMASSGPAEILAGHWGSPLLIKTGPANDVFQEWSRSEMFLRDRQSPFLARNEEYIDAQPPTASTASTARRQGTMISSFLGGELIQAEPFDKVVRGSRDADRCLRIVEQVGEHLATWHINPVDRPLADWPRLFRFPGNVPPPDRTGGPETPWLLFGRYNFRKQSENATATATATWDMPDAAGNPSLGRSEFVAGLRWDISFGQTDHLAGHLLGRPGQRDGLLHQLMELHVQFSLIHGDLNPRNILCDADRVWLIDFQHTGAGPVLADLARLEVNFRLWCISVRGAGRDATAAARRLEFLLLDHFHGSEASLEPVRELAADLGADTDDLYKIARCITQVRGQARRWCRAEFTDGRDYIAVLYLTVLSLLRHAGAGHAPAANERWGLELFWVLEESLDNLLGREPFNRGQLPYDPLRHISAEWLREIDAPRRVDYICSAMDGDEVLGPVVALRGVLQGSYHHLDAYQHTLTVMAYLEELLADPVVGLLDPSRLDSRVSETMADYGISVPPPSAAQRRPAAVAPPWLGRYQPRVEQYLRDEILTPDAQLLLKWCSLLHDVGKPGTRTVRQRATGTEVQFLGHELYGLTLLEGPLQTWFPNEGERDRLSNLICNHHRSHQLVGDYLLRAQQGVAPLRELEDLLVGSSQPGMLSRLMGTPENPGHAHDRPDIPLLLLHGYADRLSARGTRESGTVTNWATATLALLTFLACESQIVAAEQERRRRMTEIETVLEQLASEFLASEVIRQNELGRTRGYLRAACASQQGSVKDLEQHLRDTVTAEQLRRWLDGPRNA